MQQKNEMQYGNYRLFLDKEEELDYEQIEIFRFYKPLQEPYSPGKNYQQPLQFTGLEALLRNISSEDFHVEEEKVKIIYSGNNIFPFDEREQWTDSCNLLVLKEGVAIGYDRNEITAQSFETAGYRVIHSKDLLEKLNKKEWQPGDVEKTLILLPSAELSRARGGAHCMSMPLLRTSIF
jgi:arginine deiminase